MCFIHASKITVPTDYFHLLLLNDFIDRLMFIMSLPAMSYGDRFCVSSVQCPFFSYTRLGFPGSHENGLHGGCSQNHISALNYIPLRAALQPKKTEMMVY